MEFHICIIFGKKLFYIRILSSNNDFGNYFYLHKWKNFILSKNNLCLVDVKLLFLVFFIIIFFGWGWYFFTVGDIVCLIKDLWTIVALPININKWSILFQIYSKNCHTSIAVSLLLISFTCFKICCRVEMLSLWSFTSSVATTKNGHFM